MNSTRYKKVKSGVSLRCARSILVHAFHYSRLEKPTIPLAARTRLPGTSTAFGLFCVCVVFAVEGVLLHSRVTEACPVTLDLIFRVSVMT